MAKLGIFTFFTGAGFLDLGFEMAGFQSLFANELIPEFCRVYKHSRSKLKLPLPKYGLRELDIENYCDTIEEDNVLFQNAERKQERQYLTDSLCMAKKDFDLVGCTGGPPCPDFSVAGKNKGA